MTARERPIIFSAPMVRAILAGTKTQTRRVWKMPRGCEWYAEMGGEQQGWFVDPDCPWWLHVNECRCPYGQLGDRLWVREAWRFEGTDMMRLGRTHMTQDGVVSYLADNVRRTINTDWRNVETWMTRKPQSRPSIHMPRWASRITLEVTGIRIERLQDITEADAEAEGVKHSLHLPGGRFARENFEHLWWTIHGDGSWEANPWVWVVEFKRC